MSATAEITLDCVGVEEGGGGGGMDGAETGVPSALRLWDAVALLVLLLSLSLLELMALTSLEPRVSTVS